MGASLVLLHGSYGQPGVWQGVREHLALDDIEVVAPTGPSWGARRDEPVVPMSAAALARDVVAQIPEAARPVHLVGFSMGGVIALELVLGGLVGEVCSLTLFEPSATPVLRLTGRGSEAEAHATACRGFAAAVASGAVDPARLPIEANGGPDAWERLPRAAKDTLNRYAPAAARDAVMEAERTYQRAELTELSVPTLVVYGSRTVDRLRHIAEALIELLPHSEWATIAGADHTMLATHPAEIAQLIDRSVAKVAG